MKKGKGGRIACGNGAQIMLGFIKMLGGSQSISNNWQTHTLVTLKLMTSFVLYISIQKYLILLPSLHGAALTFSCINKYEYGIEIMQQNFYFRVIHLAFWLSMAFYGFLIIYDLCFVFNCWSESWVNGKCCIQGVGVCGIYQILSERWEEEPLHELT